VPPLLADAIWARAEGGRATELTPISPLTMARFLACVAFEDFKDTEPGDAQRVAACRDYMIALPAAEYLSGLHMRDAGLKPSFSEGVGRFSTTVWLTRSWTRDDVVNTLAERGEFGAGVRGVDAASQHYFARPAAELTLAQAAMLASFTGDRAVLDPWCDPEGAAFRRGRILQAMRDNLVIDDAALREANSSETALGPPPEHHRCDRAQPR
jgi:hypothetical protein